MAATLNFGRDSQAASSGHGSTRYGIGNTNYVTDVNFTSADDPTISPSDAPLLIPNTGTTYSMPIYLFGIFSGSFVEILNCSFSRSGTLGTGVSFGGKATNTYTQPAQTALSGTTDMSTPVSVSFGASDPSGSTSSTLSAAGYTEYIVLQMSIGTTVTPGDTASQTFTIQYDER